MQTNMDLNQDETIATDDDSGEVDESFYLSRSSDLRLTSCYSSSIFWPELVKCSEKSRFVTNGMVTNDSYIIVG